MPRLARTAKIQSNLMPSEGELCQGERDDSLLGARMCNYRVRDRAMCMGGGAQCHVSNLHDSLHGSKNRANYREEFSCLSAPLLQSTKHWSVSATWQLMVGREEGPIA